MKVSLCILVIIGTALAYPQREGAAYTNEAIRQAQNTFLIPKDAQIQKVRNSNPPKPGRWRIFGFQVQEGIEIGAYESIPIHQKINLAEILGDQVPLEVINNLQQQVDQIGRAWGPEDPKCDQEAWLVL